MFLLTHSVVSDSSQPHRPQHAELMFDDPNHHVGLKEEPRISGRSRQGEGNMWGRAKVFRTNLSQPSPNLSPSGSLNTPYLLRLPIPPRTTLTLKIPPFTVLKFICSFIHSLAHVERLLCARQSSQPQTQSSKLSRPVVKEEKGQTVTGARVKRDIDPGPPWPPPRNVHTFV